MSHEMQALESRVALLEEALSEDVREKLQALVGGGLLDEEMKKLVRELAEDIDNYKPPNIHKQHELLEVLLKGARPAELSNPEILVDVMVQIAVGSGSNDKLREKYMDVLRRAPCSPLANKHMIAVIDESDAVMQARRMGLNRLLRMVLLSVVDTLTDVYVLYVYWETTQYYFFAFSCAGILGCIFFTSEALWELGKAQELSTPCRVVSIVLNIASLATYSIAVIGQEVKTKPTEEGWDLHIRAKRGEAFEAGFALLPNVYSIFIAGVVKGYSSSELRLWLQVGSSFFSVASMALTSHLVDAHASLVQSRTNSICRRFFTRTPTRFLLYMYRFSELCLLVSALVLSAVLRPFGFFFCAGFRLLTTSIVMIAHGRYKTEPGLTYFNPYSLHVGHDDMVLGMRLRQVRLLEVPVVWVAISVCCARDGFWRNELFMSCAPKLTLLLVGLIGSMTFFILDLVLWQVGVFDSNAALFSSTRRMSAMEHRHLQAQYSSLELY